MTPWKPDNYLIPSLLLQRGKLRLREIIDLSRIRQLAPNLRASLGKGSLHLPHPALGQAQSTAQERVDE